MSSVASPTLLIREITPADAGEAAGLSGELGHPVSAEIMRRRIEEIAQRPDHAVFIACNAGAVVGWIHVSVVHHLHADRRAEIGGLVVTASARSAGIGRALVGRAEKWARERGLDSVVVRSRISREDAHRFY